MSEQWMVATITNGHPKVDWGETPRPADGKQVLVKVRSPRNIGHHRKYWGLLRLVIDATGRWFTPDAMHRWVKIELGHYVEHRQPNGLVFAELLPTDFAAMSQAEFKEFYDLALAAIAMEVGVDPETLAKEHKP